MDETKTTIVDAMQAYFDIKASKPPAQPRQADPKLENIFKVGDIDCLNITPATLEYFREKAPVMYEDKHPQLAENLYNMEDVIEASGSDNCPVEIINEIVSIEALLNSNDCSYFRIIYR